MKTLSRFSFALVTAMAAAPALAQDRAAPAPMAGTAAPMQQDCGKPTTKPHNHAAEKGAVGTNPPAVPPCGGAAAASAPNKAAQAKPLHNHSSFNKNQ